jgi:hypothetical protein
MQLIKDELHKHINALPYQNSRIWQLVIVVITTLTFKKILTLLLHSTSRNVLKN